MFFEFIKRKALRRRGIRAEPTQVPAPSARWHEELNDLLVGKTGDIGSAKRLGELDLHPLKDPICKSFTTGLLAEGEPQQALRLLLIKRVLRRELDDRSSAEGLVADD